jgi:predicted RNase H-like nuclease (RuvC/YqgF family)
LVEDLENKISGLQRILEEKERHIEYLRDENKKLVDHYRNQVK